VTRHENPLPTVDVLIEIEGRPGTLVFIERGHAPHGWALPGGFVDRGELLADAAVREAKEETGLDVELVELFHCYSDPARDPRQHTVSTVFIGRARGEPTGGDDAARAVVATAAAPPGVLVFDHATIVSDYLAYRASGKRPPPRR
jgi:8-oxo-dGTP diphosphatase